MATYKVKATMTIDIEVEIDADSEDTAISRFIQMDARDVIDDGMILDVYTEDEKATLTSGTFTVKTKKIDYAVGYLDLYDQVLEKHPGIDEDSKEFDDLINAEIEETKKSLPQELTLEITCDPEDLDACASDTISNETGWLIHSCEYDIIKTE